MRSGPTLELSRPAVLTTSHDDGFRGLPGCYAIIPSCSSAIQTTLPETTKPDKSLRHGSRMPITNKSRYYTIHLIDLVS